MAEGKGITWGGVIKGAVKIAAVVAVGVGIVAGVGYGFGEVASYINPTEAAAGAAGAGTTTTAGWLAGVGSSIVAGVTGVTSAVADVVTTPINWAVDAVFGDPTHSLTGNGELELAGKSDVITQGTGEYNPKLAETFAERSAEFATSLPGELAELKEPLTEALNTAKEAVEASGGSINAATGEATGNSVAVQHYNELVRLESLVTAENPDLQAIVDQWNTVNANDHDFNIAFEQAEKTALANTQEGHAADLADANKIGAIANGEHLNEIENGLQSIVAQHANANGDHLLTNVPEAWMAAGAGVAALGVANAAGRAKGQKEVMGAYTQAEMERRAAAARFAGQQQTV